LVCPLSVGNNKGFAVNRVTLAWLGASLSQLDEENSMSASQSPITGIIDESSVILDFGKYEGKSVKEVAAIDPEFYSSLVDDKGEGIYAIRRHRDKTFRLYLNPLAQMDQ
jgi:hypothetical protein